MRLCPAIFAFTVLGCGHSFTAKFTPAGAPPPTHPPNCEFQILTAPPPSFVELGTVDVEASSSTIPTSDLAEFKQVIRPRVCEAGGDAAIAITNGSGVYLKATVIVLPKKDAASTSN